MSASLGLPPVLSPTLSPIWSGMLCPPGWSCLSLSPIWSGMLCPPPWSCLSLVSRLVSPAFVFVLSRSLSFIWDAVSAPPGLVFLLSLVLSPSLSPIWSGMLCSPSRLVSQPGLLSHPVFQLVWCVRALGLSPKFHVRFVQLFGVYGGVIFSFETTPTFRHCQVGEVLVLPVVAFGCLLPLGRLLCCVAEVPSRRWTHTGEDLSWLVNRGPHGGGTPMTNKALIKGY